MPDKCRTTREALLNTAALARFIRRLHAHMLASPDGSVCFGLLLWREAAEPSGAIDINMVRDPVQLRHRTLVEAIQVLLLGMCTQAVSMTIARSMWGQLAYFMVFRPFPERFDADNVNHRDALLAIAAHIAAFSLREMGYDEMFIERALQDAMSGSNVSHVKNGYVIEEVMSSSEGSLL